MRIYELYEVGSQPRKNDTRSSNFRIYNSSLYMEAEVNVESRLEEEVTDEEFDKMVEEELEDIMETLKEYGRYPEYGIPKYVAYK